MIRYISGDLNSKLNQVITCFRGVKLTSNTDSDKYEHNGYGIEFDVRSDFSIDGGFSKNVIIFHMDHQSIVHQIILVIEKKRIF